MKNLNYALQVLTTVTENIQFDIYGPLEDQGYWAECESLISHLPDNVSISYCGSVMPADVQNTFSQYDLFFFPTKGENYGHVIAESVSMGTPVLLSDQTPWKNLENDGLGWDLPLGSPFAFSEKLDQIAKLSPDIRQEQRAIVREQALKRLLNPEIIDASRELFYSQCQITTIH